MRFEKGKSGNPGGRPKGDGEIRDLARQHTMTALNALVEIAERGENESARVAAANAILDRAWGKPAVPIVTDDVPTIITFNLGGAQSSGGIDRHFENGERQMLQSSPVLGGDSDEIAITV